MPLEIIENTDPLTPLTTFQMSPVYEMIVSLQNFVIEHRHATWLADAYAKLGEDFRGAVEFYRTFENGFDFMEMGVDYPDQADVPGFLDYIRTMEPARFIFYLLRRVFTLAEIEATRLEPAALLNMVRNFPELARHSYLPTAPYWTENIPQIQQQVADVWGWYWNGYLSQQVDRFRPLWLNAIADKQNILARDGGLALYTFITGKKELHDPLPPDYPFEQFIFIPIALMPRQAYVFYGYGRVVILFDAQYSASKVAELERLKESTLETIHALGDENRLKILRLLAHPGHRYNGKRIAEKLGMTPSTVSRHMSQLKAGDLIIEESIDNRNIIYHLKKDTLNKLSDNILDYIFS